MAWASTGRKATGAAFGVSSVSATHNSSVAGNFMVANAVAWDGLSAPTAMPISDGANGAYTQAYAIVRRNKLADIQRFIASGAGGNLTVTATPSGGGAGVYDMSIYTHEFSGGHATPLSGTPATNSGTSTTLSTGSTTPADNDCLLVAGLAYDAAASITENAGGEGFTLSNENEGGTGQAGAMDYKILSGGSGAAQSFSSTGGSSADYCAGIAAYKPAASAGSQMGRMIMVMP